MSKIHLIASEKALGNFDQAITLDKQLHGEVLVLKDKLNIGTLQGKNQSFTDLRNFFWEQICKDERTPPIIDDLEQLMQISTSLSNDTEKTLWLWLSPHPAEICAYYWVLHYLKKHQGRILIVNLGGLPFLDDEGKLFYPTEMSEISPKELVKAKKLARCITASEWEIDGDEWKRIVGENNDIRILEGGKKISSKNADYYDSFLLELCSKQPQKASKIARSIINKKHIPIPEVFLIYRLKKMASNSQIIWKKGEVELSS